MKQHGSHAWQRWAVTGLFVLLLANWLASGFFLVLAANNTDRWTWYGLGTLKLVWWSEPPAQAPFWSGSEFVGKYRLTWDYPRVTRHPSCWELVVPLWLPALLAAIPTAFLWIANARHPRRGRRRAHTKGRRRLRRLTKWGATALCAVLAMACVITKIVGCSYHTSDLRRCLTVSNGAITFKQVGGGGWMDVRGSRLKACWDLYFPYQWRPVIYVTSGGPISNQDIEIVIPLWILTVIAALATSIVWWRDRRNPAGFCQACGYDLTGNISGRCPECGRPTTETGAGE